LLGIFLNLPCPKMFMYGEENQGLSYLLWCIPTLLRCGVGLRHFWKELAWSQDRAW
jgi:hypothetical protein